VDSFEEMREIYENSPFNNYLGIKLEKFEEGAIVYTLNITQSHLNVNQAVHGGVFFSLLDSVTGATIRSVIKQPIVTVNMSIHYFAPAQHGETLTASAKVIQQGNSIVTAEGIITDSVGNVLAKSIGTFKKIRAKS
jgi:uncharacterized protein (TIGR00369 family)